MRPRIALPFALGIALTACAQGSAEIPVYQPPAGSNELLRGAIEAAPGHSLVTADIVLGAGGGVPLHYHHGEEFLTILGGSATVLRPGMPDLVLAPGEAFRIPPGTVHAAIAGPQGLRAIASWVVPDGKPLRVAVPEEQSQ
ncbi:MAG: cupin domain-containing protein [Erythrobacter sp.]|uniref:cupin domain-containing protein n=1 Tax=Erythrobacter sp. TaxID=1042 RepID=UPI003A86A34F